MILTEQQILRAVDESNKIENILRPPRRLELEAFALFLSLPEVTVEAMEDYVRVVAGAPIRNKPGMDVRVGSHHPDPGGPHVPAELAELLDYVNAKDPEFGPFVVHCEYETLHPFMDGNGRSGRALWTWQMLRDENQLVQLGFLHAFYYQSLQGYRVW